MDEKLSDDEEFEGGGEIEAHWTRRQSRDGFELRLLQVMTTDAELVAVGITEIGAIVVGMVLRSQPRLAFAVSAIRDRDAVTFVDGGSGGSEQCHHLPISCRGAFAVVGTPDKKKRPRGVRWSPAGPGFLRLRKFEREAEFVHDDRIEGEGAGEIRDADEDMRQHHFDPFRFKRLQFGPAKRAETIRFGAGLFAKLAN